MKKKAMVVALVAVAAASQRKKPRTLAQQIYDAQAEWNSWTPEKRASVRLEGNSGLRPMCEREKL